MVKRLLSALIKSVALTIVSDPFWYPEGQWQAKTKFKRTRLEDLETMSTMSK